MSHRMPKGTKRVIELLFWLAVIAFFFFVLMQLSEQLPENF